MRKTGKLCSIPLKRGKLVKMISFLKFEGVFLQKILRAGLNIFCTKTLLVTLLKRDIGLGIVLVMLSCSLVAHFKHCIL